MERLIIGGRPAIASIAFAVTLLICVCGQAQFASRPKPSVSSLEITAGAGFLDRGTTGIGAPLLDNGYDHSGGLVAELGLRLYLHGDRYLQHGPVLRLFHQTGRVMGLADDDRFLLTGLDVAYALRILLPCMSNPETSWHLTPSVGLSGLRARVRQPDSDQQDSDTGAARDAFDHEALGGVVAINFDVHPGDFVFGVTVDVREHFALGNTTVARDFMTSITLRAGVDLEL